MDQTMSTRRRGSEELELDYGDDPLQDQDQSHHAFGIKQEQQDDTKPKPIATLEVARVSPSLIASLSLAPSHH
jgi:hypothetical protein